MKRDSIFISGSLILLALLLSRGVPFVWLKRPFYPAQITLLSSFLFILSFLLLGSESLQFRRNCGSLTIGIPFVLFSFFSKAILPHGAMKGYDILFLFIGLSFLYPPSRAKRLSLFTLFLLLPLTVVDLYGYIPPFSITIILIAFGCIMAGYYPVLYRFIARKKPQPLDIMLSILAGLLCFAISVSMLVFSKGIPKNGRVLFDTGHHSTEGPDIDYIRDINRGAAFGHGRLVDLLNKSGFQCGFSEAISPDTLAGKSILALIMPSDPFTRYEIETIRRFVWEGGGLLVIGDHTDIQNDLSSLNPVIDTFGIRLRFDTVWLQTNDRKDLVYREHPVLFGLERVNFSVGASLDLSRPARPIILSRYAAFSDLGDPNNALNAYLGNARIDPGERVHDLTLVAESHYGKGRVFVMGDSSYFQNSAIYQNWAFACLLFEWLDHKEGDHKCKTYVIVALILCLLAISCIILYRRTLHAFLLPVLAYSILFSLLLSGIWNVMHFKRPALPYGSVLIDLAHHNEYATYWITRENSETGIDGLLSQIIRSGLYPEIHSKGSIDRGTLNQSKACIVICPNIPFDDGEIEAITRFVREGGGLLLVDGPRKWASSDALWEQFGLSKDRYPIGINSPIPSPLGLPIRIPYGEFQAYFTPHPVTWGISKINMVNPCKVKGGQPIAFIGKDPVISFTEYGEGRIIAIGDDRFFANYITESENGVIDYDKVLLIWNMINYLSMKRGEG